jgi:hypothetical protein
MTIMVLFAIIYQVIVPDDSTDSTTNNTNAGVICDNIAHHCTAIHESMVKRVIQRTEQYSTNKLCALRNKNVNNISRTLAQFKHETRQIVHTTSLTACTPCTLSTFIDLLDTYKSCAAHRKQTLCNDIKRLSTAVAALDRAQALLQVDYMAYNIYSYELCQLNTHTVADMCVFFRTLYSANVAHALSDNVHQIMS